MKKFVCPVCGYVHEADEMPADFKCPLCKVPGSKFKVMEEGKLAAEHEYGVYGKTVKNNPDISEEDKKFIFDQLMANFQGECSEAAHHIGGQVDSCQLMFFGTCRDCLAKQETA